MRFRCARHANQVSIDCARRVRTNNRAARSRTHAFSYPPHNWCGMKKYPIYFLEFNCNFGAKKTRPKNNRQIAHGRLRHVASVFVLSRLSSSLCFDFENELHFGRNGVCIAAGCGQIDKRLNSITMAEMEHRCSYPPSTHTLTHSVIEQCTVSIDESFSFIVWSPFIITCLNYDRVLMV